MLNWDRRTAIEQPPRVIKYPLRSNFCDLRQPDTVVDAGKMERTLMLNWLIRLLLSLAGVVTAWFVAEDASNFGLIKTMFAIILVVIFLVAVVFCQYLIEWI